QLVTERASQSASEQIPNLFSLRSIDSLIRCGSVIRIARATQAVRRGPVRARDYHQSGRSTRSSAQTQRIGPHFPPPRQRKTCSTVEESRWPRGRGSTRGSRAPTEHGALGWLALEPDGGPAGRVQRGWRAVTSRPLTISC